METSKHFLVPNHRKLSEKEASAVLKKYGLENSAKLPKIWIKDPAVVGLEVAVGDLVEITRKSFAGESKYYRVVVN